MILLIDQLVLNNLTSDESESENPHKRKEQPTESPGLRWNNLTRKQKQKLKKQKLSKSQ